MAKEALFDHAPIPTENILRIRGRQIPPSLPRNMKTNSESAPPVTAFTGMTFSCLGMGDDDGHTASLFPGTDALMENSKWVVANFVPKFNTYRVSLTYPIINAARHVCFLVNSKGKDAILAEVFSGKSNYPCAAVRPTEGNLTWILGT